MAHTPYPHAIVKPEEIKPAPTPDPTPDPLGFQPDGRPHPITTPAATEAPFGVQDAAPIETSSNIFSDDYAQRLEDEEGLQYWNNIAADFLSGGTSKKKELADPGTIVDKDDLLNRLGLYLIEQKIPLARQNEVMAAVAGSFQYMGDAPKARKAQVKLWAGTDDDGNFVPTELLIDHITPPLSDEQQISEAAGEMVALNLLDDGQRDNVIAVATSRWANLDPASKEVELARLLNGGLMDIALAEVREDVLNPFDDAYDAMVARYRALGESGSGLSKYEQTYYTMTADSLEAAKEGKKGEFWNWWQTQLDDTGLEAAIMFDIFDQETDIYGGAYVGPLFIEGGLDQDKKTFIKKKMEEFKRGAASSYLGQEFVRIVGEAMPGLDASIITQALIEGPGKATFKDHQARAAEEIRLRGQVIDMVAAQAKRLRTAAEEGVNVGMPWRQRDLLFRMADHFASKGSSLATSYMRDEGGVRTGVSVRNFINTEGTLVLNEFAANTPAADKIVAGDLFATTSAIAAQVYPETTARGEVENTITSLVEYRDAFDPSSREFKALDKTISEMKAIIPTLQGDVVRQGALGAVSPQEAATIRIRGVLARHLNAWELAQWEEANKARLDDLGRATPSRREQDIADAKWIIDEEAREIREKGAKDPEWFTAVPVDEQHPLMEGDVDTTPQQSPEQRLRQLEATSAGYQIEFDKHLADEGRIDPRAVSFQAHGEAVSRGRAEYDRSEQALKDANDAVARARRGGDAGAIQQLMQAAQRAKGDRDFFKMRLDMASGQEERAYDRGRYTGPPPRQDRDSIPAGSAQAMAGRFAGAFGAPITPDSSQGASAPGFAPSAGSQFDTFATDPATGERIRIESAQSRFMREDPEARATEERRIALQGREEAIYRELVRQEMDWDPSAGESGGYRERPSDNTWQSRGQRAKAIAAEQAANIPVRDYLPKPEHEGRVFPDDPAYLPKPAELKKAKDESLRGQGGGV